MACTSPPCDPAEFGLPAQSVIIGRTEQGSPTDMSGSRKSCLRIKTERRTRSVPEGLWIKCSACDAVLYRAELERNLNVCPKCSHHMRIGSRERLAASSMRANRWRSAPSVA